MQGKNNKKKNKRQKQQEKATVMSQEIYNTKPKVMHHLTDTQVEQITSK